MTDLFDTTPDKTELMDFEEAIAHVYNNNYFPRNIHTDRINNTTKHREEFTAQVQAIMRADVRPPSVDLTMKRMILMRKDKKDHRLLTKGPYKAPETRKHWYNQ